MNITVTFVKAKDTKNTVRFDPKDATAAVTGVLYVQKADMDKLGNPTALSVTITTEGN